MMEPEPESDSPTFLDLPCEVLENIASHSLPEDIVSLYAVCRETRRVLRTIQADAVCKLRQHA